MFDKSASTFPIKNTYIFLSHCGISPLYRGACQRIHDLCEKQMLLATDIFHDYDRTLDQLRTAAAQVLQTAPTNVAFVKNTSEGLGLVAAGYPFMPGDEVIVYDCEYPANYYPWKRLEQQDVAFVTLPNRDVHGQPTTRATRWFLEDLAALVTARTRVVAVSHVQFTSGFAADLEPLGDFCHARGIDLVIDAAQSFGALPLYPEKWHIAALATAGWKWLLGPQGTGLLYTAEAFRRKLRPPLVGAETMQQGLDYLNHDWAPHQTSKLFEYSTSSAALAAGLECCVRELPLRYGVENIRAEIFRLQDVFLAELDQGRYLPVLWAAEHRSTILSFDCPADNAKALSRALIRQKVYCTERGGYLRVAPHVYLAADEVREAARLFNNLPRTC